MEPMLAFVAAAEDQEGVLIKILRIPVRLPSQYPVSTIAYSIKLSLVLLG